MKNQAIALIAKQTGGDDEGHVVAELGDDDEACGEGPGGAGCFVEDVHLVVHCVNQGT